jgi:hypothetical protein
MKYLTNSDLVKKRGGALWVGILYAAAIATKAIAGACRGNNCKGKPVKRDCRGTKGRAEVQLGC